MIQWAAMGAVIAALGWLIYPGEPVIVGGATAICQSGAYSVSQSRRGTCAHHGGVREWINDDDR